jgi:hypothetical protein
VFLACYLRLRLASFSAFKRLRLTFSLAAFSAFSLSSFFLRSKLDLQSSFTVCFLSALASLSRVLVTLQN